MASLPSLTGGPIERFLRSRGRTETSGFIELMTAIMNPDGSRQARAFRQAVLRLLARLKFGRATTRLGIVMVASPSSGAGASSTALAVAYAAALSGDRVLLVDACSTDTDLSNIFASDFNHRGLIVLDNTAHLASITRRDAHSGLVFLPIALADLRTLRTHQRKRLANGIASLASSYDAVVIDGGALLDDESATALLPITERVLLIARGSAANTAALNETRSMIAAATDAEIVTVWNMADTASGTR
jgi:Mrp family chromosome partitioning ATPase